MKRVHIIRIVALSIFLILAFQLPVLAHVKWFSTFSFAHKPLTLGEVFNPLFLTILATCLGVIGLLVYVDDRIVRFSWYNRFSSILIQYASKSDLIIRVAAGAVLLLSWQSGALLVPELIVYNAWIEFIQLTLAIMILSNRYTVYAGYGLIVLYFFAFIKFSAIHLLDYAYLLGVGYYLTVSNSASKKKKASALPALYASIGFSLCWVALEKIVYPGWGLQILNSNPTLTLGFDPELFLLLAAFVEFILGFLLILCLLQRPIALVITFLFVSTTLVFGKLEFIGHAIVHAALIVFLIQGPGTTFRTPITFFKRINQRIGFAILSFSLLLLGMLLIYSGAAQQQYNLAIANPAHDMLHEAFVEVAGDEAIPGLEVDLQKDEHSGWNLNLKVQNFVFSPENCGKLHEAGHGHAHLYLNDQKIARLYGPWFHISQLPPGEHEIKVTLTSNNHSEYVLNGIPVSAKQSVVVL